MLADDLIDALLNEAGSYVSPFAGAKKAKSLTKHHRPLVWENMLGTVYAHSPHKKSTEYFDFDYAAAHKHAQVDKATDLRLVRHKHGHHMPDNSSDKYGTNPRPGQLVLYGVHDDLMQQDKQRAAQHKIERKEFRKKYGW